MTFGNHVCQPVKKSPPPKQQDKMLNIIASTRHLLHKAKTAVLEPIYGRSPLKRAEHMFKASFGRNINWENPTAFVEKLRWIQFRTDPTMRTRLADKLAAREHIISQGLADILVPLYGTWKSPHDIPWDELPRSLVLKTSHGSGDAVIVHDKDTVNRKAITRHFSKALAKPYGRYYAETHYKPIPRYILAEKLLHNDAAFSRSIVDYKFYCCNGNPILCMVCANRTSITSHDMQRFFYDIEWQRHNDWVTPATTDDTAVPRPHSLDQMIDICRKLSKGIPFVRIDLYESDGATYFSEFTFSPDAYKPFPISETAFAILSEKLELPEPDFNIP